MSSESFKRHKMSRLRPVLGKGRYLLTQNIVLVNFLQVNCLHMQGLVCKGKVHQAKNKPWTGDSVGWSLTPHTKRLQV